MDVLNGQDQSELYDQNIGSMIALTILYYDYALTFSVEHRLFWSLRSFKQWGSVLFFFNRYFGIMSTIPFAIQVFVGVESALFPLCKHSVAYRQIAGVVIQVAVGLTFIVRTYALYNRSRAVLVGLIALGTGGTAVSAYILFGLNDNDEDSLYHNGIVDCWKGPSRRQSRRLAVIWGCILIFDFVVFALTLVRSMQIRRRSRRNVLTHILIRDGVMYFGVIDLAVLATVIVLLYGPDGKRKIPETVTNVLASVFASRLMINLRESRDKSVTYTTTTAISSMPTSTTLSYALTNIEDVNEGVVHESLDRQDIEMDSFTGRNAVSRHGQRHTIMSA